MVSERARGIGLAASGMALLSTDSLLVRAADTNAMDILFWVGALTSIVMLPVAARSAGTAPLSAFRWSGATIVAAVLQATTVVCFVLAIEATSVANVLAILATAPFASAILAWLLLRERTPRRTWSGAGLSAVGIAVIVSGSVATGSALGVVYAGIAVAAFASLTVWMRRHRTISGPFVIGLAGLGMAVVSSPWATREHTVGTWLALAAMGLITAPLARLMLATAPRYIPAAEVALFTPIETVLGSTWAFLVFAERPGGRTLLGGAVILAGLLWGLTSPTQRRIWADLRRAPPEFGREPSNEAAPPPQQS